MPEPDELDCRREPRPRCPHCGYVVPIESDDSPNEDEATQVYDCGECEKEFLVTCHVDVTYTTRPWTFEDKVREEIQKVQRQMVPWRWAERRARSDGKFDDAAKLNSVVLQHERLEQQLQALKGEGKTS